MVFLHIHFLYRQYLLQAQNHTKKLLLDLYKNFSAKWKRHSPRRAVTDRVSNFLTVFVPRFSRVQWRHNLRRDATTLNLYIRVCNLRFCPKKGILADFSRQNSKVFHTVHRFVHSPAEIVPSPFVIHSSLHKFFQADFLFSPLFRHLGKCQCCGSSLKNWDLTRQS